LSAASAIGKRLHAFAISSSTATSFSTVDHMRRRGRPPTITAARRYPNPLREMRERLGLSQEKVAGLAGISSAYYGALERGDRRINTDIAQRLSRALGCAPGDLLQGPEAASIALRIAIAAADSEGRPEDYDLPPPYEWLRPRRLSESRDCFAAEVFDDSADLDFAKGSVLIVRELAALRTPLRRGAKIVVRFLLPAPGAGSTHEILYGLLDRNIVGDLLLVTRTRNRLVPRNALVQPARSAPVGLAERPLVVAPRDAEIAYAREADDPAEILGVVVYSMGPE
jgi:transcriptional regulator with XRE-family HTH domain